ncbi:MAG: GNAT family N-acetyltransferase [Chloroflexi bacterium]|nr:GNAT family N-acetyltransferase [Chloroflexota bacterium]
MNLKLVRYDEIREENYVDYISEWENYKEKVVPSAVHRDDRSFSEMMNNWKEAETDIPLSKGFVPATLYFLIDNNGRILGGIHFRHYLNARLHKNGGHIGYGVRKCERQKGYAREMLNLLLEKIKKQNLDKVQITCDDDNLGSAKTIESCGGIMQDKVVFENKLTRRYWIILK